MKKCLFFLFIAVPVTIIAQQPSNAFIKIRAKTSADHNGAGSPANATRVWMQQLAADADIFIYMKDSMRKIVMKRDRTTMSTICNDASGEIMVWVESPTEKAPGFCKPNRSDEGAGAIPASSSFKRVADRSFRQVWQIPAKYQPPTAIPPPLNKYINSLNS